MRKEAIRELAGNIHLIDRFDPKQFKDPQPPVVSLYLPITHTEREQRRDEKSRIEFKNLTKEAQTALASICANPRDYAGISEKLDYLLESDDLPIWREAGASLGFLIGNDEAFVFNIGIPVEPVVTASDRYYVKPLLRNAQYGMTYKLLLLNTDFFALLDGDYSTVRYVPLPDDIKHYFAETFAEFDGETTALDYYSLEDHDTPFDDNRSRNEVTQEEAEKFFRYVDKAMADTLVHDDPTPVILVTAPEHEDMFRKLATFKTLLPQGIGKDARTLSGAQLRDEAVRIMEADAAEKLAKVKEEFGYRLSKGEASDDIAQIGFALAERKVAVLFVEAGKGWPGTFDETTGKVKMDMARNPEDAAFADPAAPDIANAFAMAAISQGAMLFVLPPDQMPTGNGIAATYRY